MQAKGELLGEEERGMWAGAVCNVPVCPLDHEEPSAAGFTLPHIVKDLDLTKLYTGSTSWTGWGGREISPASPLPAVLYK